MVQNIRNLVSNSIKIVNDVHLRHVHNRMALSSLKEHDGICKLTAEEKESIRTVWNQIGYKGKGEWHRLYKAANSFDARYVPNDVYGLELLPRLNATKLQESWDDKAYYPRFFPEIKQPSAIAFVIDGLFYDDYYKPVSVNEIADEINKNHNRIIIKPSDGLEGRGVQLVEINKLDLSSVKEILLSSGRNYVIQDVIEQHDSLAIYNSSSVNPIRVMTLRMGGKIHYLHSTLRFGMPGAHTDMAFVDGKEIAHVCAVSSKGEVSNTWYDMNGKKNNFADLGIIKQDVIPNFEAIIETALAVHEGLHHFDLIGCDITVDKEGQPILIEYNVYWPGIIIPQYCHGPLFGELTEELIARMKKSPIK